MKIESNNKHSKPGRIYHFKHFIILTLVFIAVEKNISAQNKHDKCIVESMEYPGKDPAMWDGLYAAKSGKVYTGLITEGESAHFYCFDPSSNKNTLLFDIADFLGERGKGIRTSGKIHNKPVEDNDGNIYFVPMSDGAGPNNIDYSSWRGGHWMKYKPKTNTLENMGLIDEEDDGCDGFYPLTIDKERKYLFGVGFTGYLYRFDLEKRISRNFGRVSNWDICRKIFCDDKGNVYGGFPTGRIWKYDADKEEVIDLTITLPYDPTIYPVQLLNPMIDRTYDWRAIEWDPIDKVAYGVTCGSGAVLFKFDPHDGAEGKITPLVKMCDSKFLETNRKDIPFSTLAFALDTKNKRVYFVPSAREYNINKSAETFGTGQASHLIVYDINAGKRIDMGALQTPDGRKVLGCEAASVAADGTLYICGQVEVKDPQKATRNNADIAAALQLLIFKPTDKLSAPALP
jgi:hypothetical protein